MVQPPHPINPVVLKRGIAKERKEHPTLPASAAKILASDHIRLYGARAYPAQRKK